MGLSEARRSRYRPHLNYFCLIADGSIYAHGKYPYKDKLPGFETQDTVGCGYDWEKESIFFTLNGEIIVDSAMANVRGKLFPMIEIKYANFGGRPFMYNPTNTPDSCGERHRKRLDPSGVAIEE